MKKQSINIQRGEIPVLVIAYNRSDLLETCIKRLLNNGFTNLHITIDGPRDNYDRQQQQRIRAYLQQRGIPSNKIRQSAKNSGCRMGVIEGITWFFKKNDVGIVNEDDVEIHPEYMDMMARLLDKHRYDKKCLSISAHSEPAMKKFDGDLGLHKSPLCRVHGWASWKDRWEMHLEIMNETKKLSPLETFRSLPKPYRTSSIALKIWSCRKNYMDAWDYDWNLTHILTQSYSLTPCGVYSINHGYRQDAMHTKSPDSRPWVCFSKPWRSVNEPKDYIEMGKEYEDILKKCGFEKETGSYMIELFKIIAYRPFNKFIVAPMRITKKLLSKLG